MKKKITILTLLTTLLISLAMIPSYYAFSKTGVNTKMFMPASYLEYFELNSPEDIHYKNGYLVVSEFVTGDNNVITQSRLVIYNKDDQKYYTNDNLQVSSSSIAIFDKFIFFVVSSTIHYLPMDNLEIEPISTGYNAHAISIKDNVIATLNSSGIVTYTLSNDNGTPKFDNANTALSVSKPNKVLFSSNGDIYYTLDNSTINRYNPSSNSVDSSFTTTLPSTLINMTELGAYIYYTAVDGVYKMQKTSPYARTKIKDISNTLALGNICEPTGITATNNSILVADKKLNCIQEISAETDDFTTFAVTTEATSNYRLTKNAENLVMSENYLYALDNASNGKKRIVKVSMNETNKEYKKIDLSSLYGEYENFYPLTYTCSDNELLMFYSNQTEAETTYYLSMFKQVEKDDVITLERVGNTINTSATSLFYLGNEFFYADKSNNYDSTYSINLHKITFDNEGKLVNEQITENKQILGDCIDFTADVFGNFYLIYKDGDGKNYLIRYYGGTLTAKTEITYPVKNVQTDFNGNVYLLDDTNTIYKYIYDNVNRTFSCEEYLLNINIDGLNVKDFTLNYRQNDFYVLSNACILTGVDNTLNVKHLESVSRKDIDEKALQTDIKFITVNEKAKLFKVNLNDFVDTGTDKYFRNIEPIANPNTSKIYVVIATTSEYYLISYSPSFYALVRRSSVEADATEIAPEFYENNNITVTDFSGEERYLTNATNLYSRPLIDNTFSLQVSDKYTKVYLLKEVEFNGKKLSLISTNDNKTPTGFILSGHLTDTIIKDATYQTSQTIVSSGEGFITTKKIIAILVIALSLTVAMLILEKKLLFNNN